MVLFIPSSNEVVTRYPNSFLALLISTNRLFGPLGLVSSHTILPLYPIFFFYDFSNFFNSGFVT